MARVIRRFNKKEMNEFILYNQEPSSFEEAEKLIGHKLDRRKNYAIIEDKVCELIKYTCACSGCTEYDEGHSLGSSGCKECGYTGKRVHMQWVPLGENNDFN